MWSVLKQNPLRGFRLRLKRTGSSTTATLITALGIGAMSVMFSGFYAALGPMRYPKLLETVMTSSAADDCERVAHSSQVSRFPRAPGLLFSFHLSHKPAKRGASREAEEISRNRRHARGVICTLAHSSRGRMQRQPSRTARCVQTGLGDLEHLPNSRVNDISIGRKSCTV